MLEKKKKRESRGKTPLPVECGDQVFSQEKIAKFTADHTAGSLDTLEALPCDCDCPRKME